MPPALVLHDPAVLRHDAGPHHPETPGRVAAAVEALRAAGFAIETRESPARLETAIARVHDSALLERLRSACSLAPKSGAFSLFDSPDNPISSATFEAATRAVGLTLAAIDEVVSARARAAFVAVRPPGHHAVRSRAMGFCFFNTIAVAAEDLRRTHGLSRVLVADFDVHHGNGTQELFWEDAGIGYLSVHRFPFYPGTGAADEAGEGPGRGTTVNVPLPAGSADEAYAGGFERALTAFADRFRPEFVLVSAGFDAERRDPLGGMRVSVEGYARMTRALREVADVHAAGRIVSLLEGGYSPEALGEGAVEHVRLLAA